MNLNKIQIIGRIAIIKKIIERQGFFFIEIIVATSRFSKKEKETDWHKCSVSGKQAIFISKFLEVGDLVYLEGFLKLEQWEKDGEKRISPKIQVQQIKRLAKNKKEMSGDEMSVFEKSSEENN